MKLYAIKDINTGKLITGITSPPHTFWKNRKTCDTALTKYKNHIQRDGYAYYRGDKLDVGYVLNNYKVVVFDLQEVEE